MRRIFCLLLILPSLHIVAQPYNNEWIRFNQPYFKIKIGSDGIYRIPKSVLDNAGIGATDVRFFELWRNGQRVPFYPSVPAGSLPVSGYIEFWGERNDGKADQPLYRDPGYQHSNKVSLLTDTAVYFLSVNSNQSGAIFLDASNNVASNTLPAEPFFMYTTGNHFKTKINFGYANIVGVYVYSSSYDKGEFWSSSEISPASGLTENRSNLFVHNSGPNSIFTFGAVGTTPSTRNLKFKINGTEVVDNFMNGFDDVKGSISFPTSLINSGSANIEISSSSGVATDRLVLSHYTISYPRRFNFGNEKNFAFQLPAKSQGYYLEISNFNYGTTAPVLYDRTSGKRYIGNIGTAGLVKFALPAMPETHEMILVNAEAGNFSLVTSLTSKTFTRFNDAQNQGNYIIITHPTLTNAVSGLNQVNEYKNYRASAAGGGFNVIVVDINELIDQFAFGIKKHPSSIKNFLRYARATFTSSPKNALLIGRGMTYNEYRLRENDPLVEDLNLVPTFGVPASDNMLSSADGASPIPLTPIGRLSVVNGKELADYLEKLKEYESIQKNAPNSVTGRDWMKNILHVTGAGDPFLGPLLCNYMGIYKQIIMDTLSGGNVFTFCKTATSQDGQLSAEKIQQLFAEGISILNYFGHSSATTLEFNLDNPQSYSNQGKYPVFFVSGCNAGNFFTYKPQRLLFNETLSEKYVLAKQRGSIAFVASTHFGIVSYLHIYLNHLYTSMAGTDYGKSLGELNRDALQQLITSTGTFDYYGRLHAEEITLHGDPAVKLNVQPKPDFVIEEASIKINPALISIAETNFKLNAKIVNLGKAVNDSLRIDVKREYPDGSITVIYSDKIKAIRYADSLMLDIPIIATRDKGLNKITVTVDVDLSIDEMTENNNSATREFLIIEDDVRPIYPYTYAIINNSTQKLFASTANPFRNATNYVMELDTTELFNSPIKLTRTINSRGGLLEFTPGFNYSPGIVYYWRVSEVPAAGGQYRWNSSSFVYLSGNVKGSIQSHYFQHLNSTANGITFNTARKWEYGATMNNLFVRNSIYPTAGVQDNDFSVAINGQTNIASACVGNSLIFNVIDPITLKPWKNVDTNGNNLYRFGSGNANCASNRNWNFEFSYMSSASRKLMMDMMDSIPTGAYVIVRSFDYHDNRSYSATWRSDTSIHGSGKSLYHKLLQAGFTAIDSINKPRAWILIYKKGDNSFEPKFHYTEGVYDFGFLSAETPTRDTVGYITSPKFGPAKQWDKVLWVGSSIENPSNDNPILSVIGVNAAGQETVLYTLNRSTSELNISSVNASQYPYIKLSMRNVDSLTLSPYQLAYWAIDYDPVPEGAVAPNIFFNSRDTVRVGETLNLEVAFKNVSVTSFDSVAVKVIVMDKNYSSTTFNLPKYKPIVSGDTIMVRFNLNTKDYLGMNTLFVEVNPDNNQYEQYSFNNSLYYNFYVRDLDNVYSVRSGDWNNPATWSCNCVPQSINQVTIKSGHAVTITSLMGLVKAGRLILETGSIFNVTGTFRIALQ